MAPRSAVEHSVARRINAERLVLLGWSRAILLQLAHPLVAAGVDEHSTFRARPWSPVARLHHTVRAMLALTFGGDASRERALEGIRTIHRRVHGSLRVGTGRFPAGTPYSAEDPALVLWVHATLLESLPLVYDLFVAPLTDEERDAYCAEAASTAVALGAPDAAVPRTWIAARSVLQTGYDSGAAVVSDQARAVARAVLSPRFARVAGPAAWMNRVVTLGLLPPHLRGQYGFPWRARDERTFARLVPAIRTLRRVTPRRLALWPDALRPD
jgi:uncharacterized protein (DUF2236 family)